MLPNYPMRKLNRPHRRCTTLTGPPEPCGTSRPTAGAAHRLMSEHDTPIDGRAIAAGFDPNRLGREVYENPYPTYAALRAFDPVHRCPDGSYFLTRHADLDRIYRDRHYFSSDKKAVFAPKFGVGSPLYEHHTTSLVFNDPPYHARVRRQIVGALTPQVLNSMEPGVVSLVYTLLD